MAYNSGVLLFVFILIHGCLTKDVLVGTGETCDLNPGIKEKIEFIDWRHKGNLVVEWMGPGNEPEWFRYKDQAHLDTETGVLKLSRSTSNLSGLFKGQFQVKGVLQYAEITLEVINRVPPPIVSCSHNETAATLTCSVDPSVEAIFSWTGPNTFSSKNPVITVEKRDNAVYFCTAQNKLNKNTTEFNLLSCKKEETATGGHGDVIGGVFGGLVILAAVIVGVLIAKKKKFFFKHTSVPAEELKSAKSNDNGTTTALQQEEHENNDSQD